jgi:hypothetical protein
VLHRSFPGSLVGTSRQFLCQSRSILGWMRVWLEIQSKCFRFAFLIPPEPSCSNAFIFWILSSCFQSCRQCSARPSFLLIQYVGQGIFSVLPNQVRSHRSTRQSAAIFILAGSCVLLVVFGLVFCFLEGCSLIGCRSGFAFHCQRVFPA